MHPSSVDFSTIDVIVVEDNYFLRKLISEILKSFGVGSVRLADCAEEALQEVERRRPDMIFCDWVMPRSGGLTLLRALRRDNTDKFSRVPVIVISGHATDDYVAQALGEGADSYVVKPFTVKTIMEHMLKVIVQDRRIYALD